MGLVLALPRNLTRRLSVPSVAVILIGGALAVLTAGPLIMVLYGSFLSDFPGREAYLTLDGYREAFSDAAVYTALLNSLWLSVVRTVLKVGLAIFFAWVIYRTDIPFKGAIAFFIMLNFFIPNLTLLMGWMTLARPSSGFLNLALAWLPFFTEGPLNIYSYWGIIWVSVLTEFPLVFLLLSPAFKRMDASLEEASRLSGASNRTTVRKITIPVLMPAILGVGFLIFLRGMESFENELFLGLPARIFVFSTRVYYFLRTKEPPEFGPALAFSAAFLLLALLLIYLYWKKLGARQYTTVTGKGFSVRPMTLGRWRYPAAIAGLVLVTVVALLPIGVLLLYSVMDIPGYFRGNWFTWAHYGRVFQSPVILGALRNSLTLGFVSATVLMVLATTVSYIALRTKVRGRRVLDVFTWLPWAVPSIVLGIGLLLFWVGFVAPFLYGTMWLLMIALSIKSLPVGARVMNGVMAQYAGELEESSRVLGAGWLRTFRHIVFPLVRPGFMAGWLVILALALRELTVVTMLYGPESRTLTTILLEFQMSGGQMPSAVIVSLILALIVMIVVGLQRLIERLTDKDVEAGA